MCDAPQGSFTDGMVLGKVGLRVEMGVSERRLGLDSAEEGPARSVPESDREVERALFSRYRSTGDASAARKLVEAHAGHVSRLARGYRRYGADYGELISEGNLGLVIALRKYDPNRGIRFVTYATHWIRAQMIGHILKTWSIVGGATGALRSKLFFRLRREASRVSATISDREEAREELGRRLGLPPERVDLLLARVEGRDLSTDHSPKADGGPSLGLGLASESPDGEAIAIACEREALVQKGIRRSLDQLDRRGRLIVESRWMADEASGDSLASIGRRLGVSRERTRQLETRALDRMRQTLRQEADLMEILR